MYRVKWHINVGPLLLPFTSYWSVFLLNSRYYIIVNIISYVEVPLLICGHSALMLA